MSSSQNSAFQELFLHPQRADLAFHLSPAGTLKPIQRLLRLRITSFPLVHSVPKRALINLELTSNFTDTAAGVDGELQGLSLEKGCELSLHWGHRPIHSSRDSPVQEP